MAATLPLFFVLWAPGAAADRRTEPGASDPLTTLSKERQRYLRDLARSVHAAFRTPATDHPVFSCCVDWHSSVHAHWALLWAAYRLGDADLQRVVVTSLNADGLAAERRFLERNPGFEMPYGRAWFLRLAIDHQRITGSRALQPMAAELARSLRRYFRRHPPTVAADEYTSATWALRQLHDWYRLQGDRAGVARVRRTVEENLLEPAAPVSMAHDLAYGGGFFSRWGNWAHLLAAVLEPAALQAWLDAHRPGRKNLAVLEHPETAHHLGMNFSRAWGLWSLGAATESTELRAHAARHIIRAMDAHDRWKNDYRAYGHWVAQFGIYALSRTWLDPGGGVTSSDG